MVHPSTLLVNSLPWDGCREGNDPDRICTSLQRSIARPPRGTSTPIARAAEVAIVVVLAMNFCIGSC